ncbi:M1 family metallopeptidase [Balneolaceae bacterium YR4-1]|uniref:M1 family metallopeptidase n=1 Tax=Halalkalibaculum roseum TaxID=2709311 RepID=A0A6M1SV89_9BACT|nr:M1 family metallopeptidase [Halalkalibaculum roseum]NGP76890.1 M1 family metallopeptidase [Halalkalibaculum roseum]
MKRTGRLPLALLFLLLLFISPLQAQDFDFEKYPKLNFNFSQLNLDLTIDPENNGIKGTAAYELSANIGGVDSLVLQAAHMDIASVSINDAEASFTLNNDSLFIQLPDSTLPGKTYSLTVDYSTIPKFGILSNDLGTVWTSLLPQSHKHWFPTIDHPRVTFNSTLSLTVPSGYQAVANGVKLEEEILDVEQVRYVFKTRNEIPTTSLTFAVGRLERNETSFGVKKINLNAESGLWSAAERKTLLQEAAQILKRTEEQIGMKYPYERLNIVMLQDHFWETKTWGASVIFIHENGGNLQAQLRRGIYGQWFGVYQREEQWANANAVNLLQTALHYRLQDSTIRLSYEDIPSEKPSSVYDTFGPSIWNTFQGNYDNLEKNFLDTIEENLPSVLAWGEGVYDFSDYGEFWYQKTGQPVFELKMEGSGNSVTESMESDTVIYRVDYTQNTDNIKLTFEALQGGYEELVTLPLVQVSANAVDTSQVTFTGARDSVTINVPALVENVSITTGDRSNLILEQYKPASFLIYQLRNAASVEERIEAAEKLGYHSDDPDLQLAIKDFMNRELDPRVKAALLRSFGEIAGGASGTEQVFLEALQNENRDIREAALSVLQNYPDSETVQQRVRDYALEADSLKFYKNATRIYSSVSDSNAFESFVSNMVSADTAGHKAIFAIQELANRGSIDRAVRQAEFYISDVYDFKVRSAALKILLQHDHAPADWEVRTKEMLSDSDPRIRYITVNGLPKITGLDYRELLESVIQDEYDQRVFKAMESILSRES